MSPSKLAYAAFPAAPMFVHDGLTAGPPPDTTPKGYPKMSARKAIQQLIWGDEVEVVKRPRGSAWWWISGRGEQGWARKETIQKGPVLEVSFVDVGQGDGCLVVLPDAARTKMVIDAGQSEEMHNFLRWRFAHAPGSFKPAIAVISHPDEDHYGGFKDIFADQMFAFDSLYHNGLMERHAASRSDRLGTKLGASPCLCVDLVRNKTQLRKFLKDVQAWDGKRYAGLVQEGLLAGAFGSYDMLCTDSVQQAGSFGYLPGFEPASGSDVHVEVLGPVVEKTSAGKAGLRWLSGLGPTKNGHSVVLKLCFGQVRLLLGGDLNAKSESFLLEHHSGENPKAKTKEKLDAFLKAARSVFQVDVAKSCHHGSHDFTDTFLMALNPLATVISSGDNEPHSHPTADALGASGRWGRQIRPLVFSTELARSPAEMPANPHVIRDRLERAAKRMHDPALDPAVQAEARAVYQDQLQRIERSVAVFGTIYLRTDGQDLVMAFKREAHTSRANKWDIYRLERQASGELSFVPKKHH